MIVFWKEFVEFKKLAKDLGTKNDLGKNDRFLKLEY